MKGEVWRLVTNFLYLGPIGLRFFFHFLFLYRYARNLEEGSFRYVQRFWRKFEIFSKIFSKFWSEESYWKFFKNLYEIFRGRTADFVLFFLFSILLLTVAALFINVIFLGEALGTVFVYVWARRNPYLPMAFFGFINFQVNHDFFEFNSLAVSSRVHKHESLLLLLTPKS